ncbi:MAG: hypothetical protein HY796_02640 [Elusimicrobia bacterium]|nr:hypothetical protein [Elusimicrobiota bacterium]
MTRVPGKKSKTTQYVVGAVVAVVILLLWISIPLMNTSSLDSSVSANPFRPKTADLNSLGSDIPSEGGAPGYALNGSMIDNPATSGEMIASSLFQLGPGETENAAPADASAAGGSSGSSGSGGSAFAGARAPAAHKGKLNAMPSLGAGNANSMSAGGAHKKLFGAANAKPELTPLSDQGLNKSPGAEKRNALVAMLQNMEAKSAKASKAGTIVGARDGATSAFDKVKGDASLNTGIENSASGAGLELGEAVADFKKSDPKRNNKKITLPEPKPTEDKSKEADEEFKRMLMQMIIQSLLGPIFSNIANSIFAPTPA